MPSLEGGKGDPRFPSLCVRGKTTNEFDPIQRFIKGKLQKWHNEQLTNSIEANTVFTQDEAPSLEGGKGDLRSPSLHVRGVVTNESDPIQRFDGRKLKKWHNEQLTNSVEASTAFTPPSPLQIVHGRGN